MPPSRPYVLFAVLLLAACATGGGDKPTHTVEAVGKVIDSLASQTGNTVELIVAEFLRTRLLEQGITVHKVCAARCLEITLQEFATNAPNVSELTPGQVLTVATGGVPVLGSLTRNLSDREREAERARARTTGLLVTFAARDGDKFTARSHVVAIVSASSGEVALEQK